MANKSLVPPVVPLEIKIPRPATFVLSSRGYETRRTDRIVYSGCGRLLPETLSRSEAYRRYGRTCVDRWIAEGLITPHGTKISRAVLGAVSAASNRLTYLPVAER
ncbi:hypothetical protein Mucpa_6869 [Mucilaginibacter paludis DSM 18603]|uniref:Uncharacterized protein n=2 Tax=Mucilaginibacter TaxID=423349 RepID=H1Y3X3_9SPHI|nr:hypothetical protein Mucpa_6869 [Mucilaginibacter paludis DSM 18603]